MSKTAVLATWSLMALILGSVLMGCPSDSPDGFDGSGQLGRASIWIHCTPQDSACERGQDALEPATPVAVGATFSLIYSGQIPKNPNGSPEKILFASVSPAMLEPVKGTQPQQFIARKSGMCGLVAHSSIQTATDFVHIPIADIHNVLIAAEHHADTSFSTLSVGQKLAVRAYPRDHHNRLLAGTLSYQWQSPQRSIKIVDQAGPFVTIEATQTGQATLQVTVDTGSSTIVGEQVFSVQESNP